MTKTILSASIAAVLSVAAFEANSALTNSSVLNIDLGIATCVYGPSPTSGNSFNENGCAWGTQDISGSYFAMDSNGDGHFTASENTSIVGNDGINLGTAQAATGSHSGPVDGSESPGIDAPWLFFSNTGMHYTNAPTNVSNAVGNTAEIDFSGWNITWNGIAAINMGGGAQDCGTASDDICVREDGTDVGGTFYNGTGVATITCGVDCSQNDTYRLEYHAVTFEDFSVGSAYKLILEGTVTSIPVPAAVWLYGSGLTGLMGIARKKSRRKY